MSTAMSALSSALYRPLNFHIRDIHSGAFWGHRINLESTKVSDLCRFRFKDSVEKHLLFSSSAVVSRHSSCSLDWVPN